MAKCACCPRRVKGQRIAAVDLMACTRYEQHFWKPNLCRSCFLPQGKHLGQPAVHAQTQQSPLTAQPVAACAFEPMAVGGKVCLHCGKRQGERLHFISPQRPNGPVATPMASSTTPTQASGSAVHVSADLADNVNKVSTRLEVPSVCKTFQPPTFASKKKPVCMTCGFLEILHRPMASSRPRPLVAPKPSSSNSSQTGHSEHAIARMKQLEARIKQLEATIADLRSEQHDARIQNSRLLTTIHELEKQLNKPAAASFSQEDKCELMAEIRSLRRKKFAILVGIGAGYRVGKLNNPTNDCSDAEEKLKNLGWDVSSFIDTQATKANIEIHLQRLLDDINSVEKDLKQNNEPLPAVMFYFSGHGCSLEGQEYLCIYDGQTWKDQSEV